MNSQKLYIISALLFGCAIGLIIGRLVTLHRIENSTLTDETGTGPMIIQGATMEFQGWQKVGMYYNEVKKKLIYTDNLGREFQIEATLQKVKLK
jgi:hypothetical protein